MACPIWDGTGHYLATMVYASGLIRRYWMESACARLLQSRANGKTAEFVRTEERDDLGATIYREVTT